MGARWVIHIESHELDQTTTEGGALMLRSEYRVESPSFVQYQDWGVKIVHRENGKAEPTIILPWHRVLWIDETKTEDNDSLTTPPFVVEKEDNERW